MFEKEAEEIAKRKISNFIPQQWGVSLIRTVPTWETVEGAPHFYLNSLAKMWQDGAEFGYNKANEWHYVKDGNLPKAYQECYFIYSNCYKDNKVIFSKSNINVLTGIYAYVIDEETGEETTEPCFYDDINDNEIDLSEVYAWKEIVLPDLPKESE